MKKALFFLTTVLLQWHSWAQAPNIHYVTPQTYVLGTAITDLIPTNTGGATAPVVIVSTLAGAPYLYGLLDGIGTVAKFDGPQGITVDAAGTIYVADTNNHRIRKITSAGVVSTFAGSGLTGFNTVGGSADGISTVASFNKPQGITIDAAGTIYVADSGNNKIRKITSAGVVTTLAGSGIYATTDGLGTAASFINPKSLAVDTAGNVYVAAGCCDIRKITPQGLVSTLALSASFYGLSGITIDSSGYLYVLAENTISKISPSGVATVFAGSGVQGSANGLGTAASFNMPQGIAVDAAGTIYVSDTFNQKIRKISSGAMVSTLAGSGTFGNDNGAGSTSSFFLAYGVAVDMSGNVYVADASNNNIRKIIQQPEYTISPVLPIGLFFNTTNGTISGTPEVTSPATNYTVTAYNNSGNSSTTVSIATISANLAAISFSSGALNESFMSATTSYTAMVGTSSITATALDATATIKIRINNNPVYSIIPNGSASGTLALNLGTNTINLKVTAIDGVTTKTYSIIATKILAPAISYPSPQTYAGGTAIAPLAPSNTGGGVYYGQVTTFAGDINSNVSYGGPIEGMIGTAANLDLPSGVAVDASDNVYVSDYGHNTIQKISPKGVVTTLAGVSNIYQLGVSSDIAHDGIGTQARFNTPKGVAVDASGNVYVADSWNNKIRKISPLGMVTTIAGSGTQGNADGAGTAASFYWPEGVAVAASGSIYVTDTHNFKIRKITTAGIVSTFAGSGIQANTGSEADGTGIAASFSWPSAITITPSGTLYVTDGNKIRKITSTGVVTTIAGSASGNAIDGMGIAASFGSPSGIAVDASNTLYVSDSNNKIRKIGFDGMVSTLAGNGQAGNIDGWGNAATISVPKGIAVNSSGTIYVAEDTGRKVRQITQLGFSASPNLPSGLHIDPATGIISGTPTAATATTAYLITACNVAGCTTATLNITTSALGINSFAENGLKCYPNPTTTLLHLELPNETIIDRILITDQMGKIIHTQTINTNQINTEILASGIYFIQVYSGDIKWQSKFIKE